jgi:hypothetical protein
MKAAGDFDVAVIDEAAQALEALNSHSGCPLFPALCAQSLFVSRPSVLCAGRAAGGRAHLLTWGELSAGHVLSGF